MKQENCRPCQGIESVTPRIIQNLPGQRALRYRVGNYSDFFESMLAALSRGVIPGDPSKTTDPEQQVLRHLTARDKDDPSIALLDAWAVLADVLTFYNERYASEAFLRTALQSNSLYELASQLGYTPRPGLASSVYLTFEVDDKSDSVLIPAGTQAKSTPIPGSGQLSETFETTQAFIAHPSFNKIRPRLTRPQDLSENARLGLKKIYLNGIGLRIQENDFIAITNKKEHSLKHYQVLGVEERRENPSRSVTILSINNPLKTAVEVQKTILAILDPLNAIATSLLNTNTLTQAIKSLRDDNVQNLASVDITTQKAIAAMMDDSSLESLQANQARITQTIRSEKERADFSEFFGLTQKRKTSIENLKAIQDWDPTPKVAMTLATMFANGLSNKNESLTTFAMDPSPGAIDVRLPKKIADAKTGRLELYQTQFGGVHSSTLDVIKSDVSMNGVSVELKKMLDDTVNKSNEPYLFFEIDYFADDSPAFEIISIGIRRKEAVAPQNDYFTHSKVCVGVRSGDAVSVDLTDLRHNPEALDYDLSIKLQAATIETKYIEINHDLTQAIARLNVSSQQRVKVEFVLECIYTKGMESKTYYSHRCVLVPPAVAVASNDDTLPFPTDVYEETARLISNASLRSLKEDDFDTVAKRIDKYRECKNPEIADQTLDKLTYDSLFKDIDDDVRKTVMARVDLQFLNCFYGLAIRELRDASPRKREDWKVVPHTIYAKYLNSASNLSSSDMANLRDQILLKFANDFEGPYEDFGLQIRAASSSVLAVLADVREGLVDAIEAAIPLVDKDTKDQLDDWRKEIGILRLVSDWTKVKDALVNGSILNIIEAVTKRNALAQFKLLSSTSTWKQLVAQYTEISSSNQNGGDGVSQIQKEFQEFLIASGINGAGSIVNLLSGATNTKGEAYRALRPKEKEVVDAFLTSYRNRQPSLQVYDLWVFRSNANLFGWNSKDTVTLDENGKAKQDRVAIAKGDILGDGSEVDSVDLEAPNRLFLDGKFQRTSVDSPVLVHTIVPKQQFFLDFAQSVSIAPRARYKTNADATRIELYASGNWWSPAPDGNSLKTLQTSKVYCDAEKLELAEEILSDGGESILTEDLDVTANTIRSTGNALILDSCVPELVAGSKIFLRGAPTVLLNEDSVRSGRHTLQSSSDPIFGELYNVVDAQLWIDPSLYDDVFRTAVVLDKPLSRPLWRSSVEIFANVVEATHGETVAEVLGSGDARKPLQSFPLRRMPLTRLSAPNPLGKIDALQVTVSNTIWDQQSQLVDGAPNDEIYELRGNRRDPSSTLQFGNGVHGTRLPTGVENVKATYRVGLGEQGNAVAGQINQLPSPPFGVKSVNNPLAGDGGSDADTVEQVRVRIPAFTSSIGRLVSASDFESFALCFAGINKAKVIHERGELKLIIAGASTSPISPQGELYRNFLSAIALQGVDIRRDQIQPHSGLLLHLYAQVSVPRQYDWAEIQRKIEDSIFERFGYASRQLGQSIHASDVIETIQRVREVQYVVLNKLIGLSAGDAGTATADSRITSTGIDDGSNPKPESKLQLFETVTVFDNEICYVDRAVKSTVLVERLP